MKEFGLINMLDTLEGRAIPGCTCVVYHNHKQVFKHSAGFADKDKIRPVTGSTLFWLYSTTKVITCTAIMQLAEKGKLRIDDPVYKYLPEFEKLKVRNGALIESAKELMTIRHLLSMQSGLSYNVTTPSILKLLEETGKKATTRQIVEAIAQEPLDFEPGTHFQYSLSHDVLGAVIEVVSGLTFGQYLDENIFFPLGMKNTGFEYTVERKANIADQFTYRDDSKTAAKMTSLNGFVMSERFESGGAGLISSADDYIMFLDAMCNDGISSNGYRVLSREFIDEMRTNQLHGTAKNDFDAFGKIGYGYGLGVRTLVDKEISGARSPLGEFGWDGAAGAYALIDVENRLAIFYAQHVRNCGHTYTEIHPKLRDLTYEMLGL